MKQFIQMVERTTPKYVSLINSCSSDLGTASKGIKSFALYLKGDCKKNIDDFCSKVPDIMNVSLEGIISNQYRFLFLSADMLSLFKFIEELNTRISDFKGKETNLRVVIGFYSFYLMLVVKLVEVYAGTLVSLTLSDPYFDIKDVKLADVGIDTDGGGIDNSVLRNFSLMDDLRAKTIDEWITVPIDDVEERYFSSAFKRIFYILGF